MAGPDVGRSVREALRRVLEWYFREVYGRFEGPETVPYYCDPRRVGHFAVNAEELVSQSERALFRLLVMMAMFQARRDVVIMKQQLGMSARGARVLSSLGVLTQRARVNNCPALLSAEVFEARCSVGKQGEAADCAERPGASCHVKDATTLFKRMGDMGKLPTSAWLRIWREGGLGRLLGEVRELEAQPTKRAALLVERISRIYRVGTKLATMYVSALSTPALAPGLTPWFPAVDGNELVVIDTHVSRAVDALRAPRARRTYAARASWLRGLASTIDLGQWHAGIPSFSPRLVQQAFYAFCSKSNRVARGDACSDARAPCGACVPPLCPFGRRDG